MQYRVLARKYRPQIFDQLYAQEHVTKILASSIEKDRIANAYLFAGPRGVGKTSLARIFAKSLNCQEGTSTNPCGKCSNCVEIEKSISYDVVEIDGASNTGVNDIRELQKELMFTTVSSKYKIYIIDEVHMLSTNAFNALLKTLEEPPEKVVFLFATTQPQKILATILSRCQRFDLKKIPIDTIIKCLKEVCKSEKISFQETALFSIAQKADGGMRDALSLLDQLISYSSGKITLEDVFFMFGLIPTKVFVGVLEGIFQKDAQIVLDYFHNLVDNGSDIMEFVSGLLAFIRSLLLLKATGKCKEILPSMLEQIKELSKKFKDATLVYMLDILIKIKTDIRYSDNQLLLVEIALVKLSRIEQVRSVDKILDYFRNQKSIPVQVPRTPQVNYTSVDSLKNNYKNQEVSSKISKSKQQEGFSKYTSSTKVDKQADLCSDPPEQKQVAKKYPPDDSGIPPKGDEKNLSQETFTKAVPKLITIMKENKFNIFLTNIFWEVQKNVLPDNILEIVVNNSIDHKTITKFQEDLMRLLKNYFGFRVRLNIKKKKSDPITISKGKTNALTVDKIIEKDEILGNFIKDIGGKLIN